MHHTLGVLIIGMVLLHRSRRVKGSWSPNNNISGIIAPTLSPQSKEQHIDDGFVSVSSFRSLTEEL